MIKHLLNVDGSGTKTSNPQQMCSRRIYNKKMKERSSDSGDKSFYTGLSGLARVWLGNSVGNSDAYPHDPLRGCTWQENTGPAACSTHAPGMRPGILTESLCAYHASVLSTRAPAGLQTWRPLWFWTQQRRLSMRC